MRYKTYEADKEGKIYIYPSIDIPREKIPDILKVFIKNLIDVARSNGKEPLRKE